MKFKIRKREQITFLLIVFMTFALMPNIISIFGYSLKVMYLIFVLLLFQILRNKEVYKPNMVLFIFWGYICLLSLMTTFKWGIDRLLINYCFGFIIITIFTSIGKNFQEQDWMDILKIVWGLLFTGILLNNIFQAYRFVEYFSYGLDHPFIKTVVTGGVNLEATWISILVLAFFYSKKRWIPLGISVFISFLYASRVAMISNIIVLFVFIYGEISADTRKKFFNRRIVVTLLSIVAIGILIAGSAGGGMLFQVISRFKDIGHDPGSLGRLAMWRYVFPTICKYPFGVGLGNVIQAIEIVSPIVYEEDNIHNIFLQMFCEIGVLGGFGYVYIWVAFLNKELKKILNSPIVGMLFIYFVLGFFQFKGGETIFFCLLGIYLSIRRKTIR